MKRIDSAALDRKILQYVKAKGTTNVNRVARQFKVKWETAERSLKRLMAKAQVFYHPDMKLWSIWADYQLSRHYSDGQTDEKREKTGDSDVLYARFIPQLKSTVRGEVAQITEKVGFVCHPRTKGYELPRSFIRGHIHGHYSVVVIEEGRMPSTFADSDLGYSGKWYSKPMNGNIGYFGEITIPDDPYPFKVQALSNKEGRIRKFSVYVHPRYIYYDKNVETASVEFVNQVRDVLDILERYGWRFGDIKQCGNYSMGINDRILASHVPTVHVENETDPVKYDSSPGKADGVCTEAEIFADHPTAEAEAAVMAELPVRILDMEDRMETVGDRLSSIETRLTDVSRIVEMNTVNTERLVSSVEGLSKLTEFNTNVLLGTQTVPTDGTPNYIAHSKKGDVMYG